MTDTSQLRVLTIHENEKKEDALFRLERGKNHKMTYIFQLLYVV